MIHRIATASESIYGDDLVSVLAFGRIHPRQTADRAGVVEQISDRKRFGSRGRQLFAGSNIAALIRESES